MKRGRSCWPATSSGRAISSGRRHGPGATAPSCSRPTSAACSATRPQGHPHLLHRRAAGSASAMTAATICSTRRRGFRLSGRVSPEMSAHGGHFTYAPRADRRERLSSRVRQRGRRRAHPARHDLRRRSFDIAPSRRFYSGGGGSVRGYGYQQLGPKDVDGDPIGGRGLAEFALEARIRLKQFGGNFGIVPFFDGGSLTTGAARLRRLAVRGRARRALLFELRPDPHRRRRPAQPPEGRRPGRGHRLARPGVLTMAEARRRRRRRGAAAPAAAQRLAAAAAQRAAGAVHRAAVPARRRAGAARYRARASLHRRPHRRARDRVGPQASASGASTARSSASRSCATSRVSDTRGVFLTSPNIKLDWAPGAWLNNKLSHRQPDRRAGHADPPAEDQAERDRRARSCPGSTSTSASCGSTGSMIGPQVSGKARSGSVRGKADVHRAAR